MDTKFNTCTYVGDVYSAKIFGFGIETNVESQLVTTVKES